MASWWFWSRVHDGIGVNMNRHDVSDSFAWRVGGGTAYA